VGKFIGKMSSRPSRVQTDKANRGVYFFWLLFLYIKKSNSTAGARPGMYSFLLYTAEGTISLLEKVDCFADARNDKP